MPDSATSPRISRRTLLKAGIAGGAALLLARWLYTSTTTPQSTATPHGALDAGARAIVAAIAPVMLAGALPANDPVLLQRDRRGRRAGDRRPAAGGAQGGRPALRAAVVRANPRSDRRHMVAVARGIAGIDRRLSRSVARQPTCCCCDRPTARCISSCSPPGTAIRTPGRRSATPALRRSRSADDCGGPASDAVARSVPCRHRQRLEGDRCIAH